MIQVYDGNYFACDECPLMCQKELAMRLELEKEYGEFQFDHLGCDKVQHDFFAGGYCGDAFEEDDTAVRCKPRKSGAAYRRLMKKKKYDKRMKIMTYGYKPSVGYTDWDWVDGVFRQTGNHIKYPKNSNRQVYWKNQSNRKVRRSKGYLPKGGSYKKQFEYAWMID